MAHHTTSQEAAMTTRPPIWKIVTRDAAEHRHDVLVPATSLPAAVAAAEKTLGDGERITAAFLSAAPEHVEPDLLDEFDRTGFDRLDWACLVPDE